MKISGNLESYAELGTGHSLRTAPSGKVRTTDPYLPPNKPEPAQPSAVELKGAVERVSEALKTTNLSVKFSEDSDSGQTVVQVVDGETNTVLRQIPSVEMLALSKSLEKMQGLLIRQQA
ncbi:MAG: flagellar protein FlaG [Burkholderiaceae bacterium]